jgi:hypothetical protein
MRIKELIIFLYIILIAGAFYLCCPKYEIYQSLTGTYTYRFNKITGEIQIGDPKNGKWGSAIPIGPIQKP